MVINSTWLIKGVLSEISGGLLDLVYLWLTNQIYIEVGSKLTYAEESSIRSFQWHMRSCMSHDS